MEFAGDCSRCVGLCCVGLIRTRASGFGADLPAGTPCHHLQDDNRCEIHATLRADGWPACTVFDCFGAGQQVTQITFEGTADWRDNPKLARSMFSAFATMRHLMEMLALLTQAQALASGTPVQQDVDALTDHLTHLTRSSSEDLDAVNVDELRQRVGPLLAEVSERHRHPAPVSKKFHPRAQFLGTDLHGQDLSRYSLRGALLIAVNLRGAVLNRTDLLGADLRDADLSGADLRGALFLTQQQVDSAKGDGRTLLPVSLSKPQHWR